MARRRVMERALDLYGRIRMAVGRRLYEPAGFEDTGDDVMLEDLDLDHPEWNYYTASGWTWLGRVLDRGKVRPSDVFVDFGSGKGRVVYQAARYPFARVIGVEVAEEMNRIARANLEHGKRKLACREVELVTCDAADYEIPDDMTYAYFYNPFSGETFRRVVANILASIDRNPRRVTLIYLNPEMERELLDTGRFELVEKVSGGHRRDSRGRGEIFVYRNRL